MKLGHDMINPWLLALALVGLAVLVGAISSWVRHRPHNLSRGTQHIVITGLAI